MSPGVLGKHHLSTVFRNLALGMCKVSDATSCRRVYVSRLAISYVVVM
jgi:hypothetical protein